MLALDSTRWDALKASPGGSGRLAASLIRELRAGDAKSSNAWSELAEQACHQLSVGEVAFAIVPHVVDIAQGLPHAARIEALITAGTVAACVRAFPSAASLIPTDLAADYQTANLAALRLASEALARTGWTPGEVTSLLGATAALQGHHNLAIHLLLHGGSNDELSCPECGEYLRWDSPSDPA